MDALSLLYSIIIYPIIYIFPAYAANGAPVLFGGGRPIDCGRRFMGKRIFGDHKTIRGLAAGLVAGSLVGVIEYPFFPYMPYIAIGMAVGAMVGDLLGSFMKRRFDVKSGASLPMIDQYGFFAFALLFAYSIDAGQLLAVGAAGLIFITVLTGILHLLTNMGAHKLKLKSVPW